MSKKKNLIFICLLILGVFLITSCLPKPPLTEGILKGQVIVPEGSTQAKQLTGQALANATINIIDPATGAIIATTTTDANGYYQVFVPAGGPYLLEAVKDGVKVLQITPQVEVGIEYDLGTADCSTTAVALIALAMMDAGANLADINLADIAADPDFDDVLSSVTSIIEAGEDPTESAVIQQAVEDFLSPPAPTPTYTVTFDSQGGSAVNSQTVEEGGKATEPTAPTRTGYTFGGWYKESGCTNAWDFDTDTVTADVTLYAKWTINTYTVTYDGNGSTGGTVPSDANNYEQGDSVTVLDKGDLVKNQDGISFLFTGWNTAADGSGTSYNEADTFNMGTENVTLYAKWSAVKATGPAGGLIFYDKGFVSDGWRYLEAAPVSTKWTNKQWGSYTILIGGTATGIGTGQSNTTAIVVWLDANSDDTYGDVTDKTDRAAYLCDTLGYGGFSDWFLPSKKELNLMYTNLHNIVTPVGDFANVRYWSSSETNANGAWYQDFNDGSKVTSYKNNAYRVRAVRAFRSTSPTYIVKYNDNGATGGTVPSDGYHYEPGETVTVLDKGDLVKTNYTFAGWNTQADGTGTVQAPESTFDMGSENVTLFAQWTINTYTVTFNSQGGTAVSSQTVNHGGKATEPTAPTKTGHTFGGWYKELECTNTWNFDTDTVTADVTLYAKWTINTYTVIYNGNVNTGGTVPVDSSSPYEYGATVTVLDKGDLVKTQDGISLLFEGWNTQADGNGIDRAPGSTFAIGPSNVTLYAKWSAIRATGPAGGLIFYDRGSYTDATPTVPSWRYLEAAPSDQSTSAEWGCNNVLLSGADGTAVGTGEQNTIDIETGCPEAGTAADICANLSLGGESDWFLPSKYELDLMYTNLHDEGVGGFVSFPVYWSSSEYNKFYAWAQSFNDGNQHMWSKVTNLRVRAVRAF